GTAREPSSVVITTRGRQSSNTHRNRSAGYPRSNGTYAPPATTTACRATTRSTDRGTPTATTSPGPTPRSTNTRANRFTRPRQPVRTIPPIHRHLRPTGPHHSTQSHPQLHPPRPPHRDHVPSTHTPIDQHPRQPVHPTPKTGMIHHHTRIGIHQRRPTRPPTE